MLSPFIQEIIGIRIRFTGSDYLLFILSVFIYFYGGKPFIVG